jgi:hypothetical protein
MIDLIGDIYIVLTGMDWMYNVMVKKVDVWSHPITILSPWHQPVTFFRLGHIQSHVCHPGTSRSHLVDLVTCNHNFVTLAPAGTILST